MNHPPELFHGTGETSTLDHPSRGDDEHPLLDFGDANEGPFFPSLKAVAVQSAAFFDPRAG